MRAMVLVKATEDSEKGFVRTPGARGISVRRRARHDGPAPP